MTSLFAYLLCETFSHCPPPFPPPFLFSHSNEKMNLFFLLTNQLFLIVNYEGINRNLYKKKTNVMQNQIFVKKKKKSVTDWLKN